MKITRSFVGIAATALILASGPAFAAAGRVDAAANQHVCVKAADGKSYWHNLPTDKWVLCHEKVGYVKSTGNTGLVLGGLGAALGVGLAVGLSGGSPASP